MEEKTIIFCKEVWLRPIQDPTRALMVEKINKIIEEIFVIFKDNKIIGPIFCEVINKSVEFQFKPEIIEGSHWWKGAAANLIIKALIKINELIVEKIFMLNNLIIIITEAIAWIIKYFKAASLWYLLFFFMIKGIKTIRLISKANQVINQEFVDEIITIDKNIIMKNIKLEGWRIIII